MHEPVTKLGKLDKKSWKFALASPLLAPRPIATNSRVKQDEKYRKDVYLAYVENALQQKTNGNNDAFDELVNEFNPKKIPDDGASHTAQIRLWISALCHVVSRLERIHAALVEAVVMIPWTTMDSTTVKSYVHFVGMLLSARPEYLSLVLSRITHGFTYQSGLQALDTTMPEGSSSPLTRRVIYDRLHTLLEHIYTLIPTLPSTLQPLLVHHFPHKRQSQVAQITYIRNLLRVSESCPELADSILATIIEHAIQIDVEIQVELEELEDEQDEQDEDLFEFDPFDAVLGQEEDEDDSDSSDPDDDDDLSDLSSDAGDMDDMTVPINIPTNFQHIRDMVQKLDAILNLLFDHLDRHQATVTPVTMPEPFSSPPRSDSPPPQTDPIEAHPPAALSLTSSRRSQFNALLSIFERTIICTFKSRYTQFLIFWYSSLDSEFSDIFQGMLVSKALLQQDLPEVTRAAAASYIASFVSRAKFIDRDGARRVMTVLCNFLRSHLDLFHVQSQSDTEQPGAAHHIVFYAVSQAVFLIFCFRWRDFLEGGEDDVDELLGEPKLSKKWMTELRVVQRLITSPLNPLKVCSPNVVMQFARVAQSTGFIYCYSIMEANKRSEYGSIKSAGSTSRQPFVNPVIVGSSINAELNTFFPFDPYKLPKSNSYIQGVYREWSSVAIDDDGDNEEDEEDNETQEEIAHGHLDIPRPNSVTRSGGLMESLDAMSISPLTHLH